MFSLYVTYYCAHNGVSMSESEHREYFMITVVSHMGNRNHRYFSRGDNIRTFQARTAFKYKTNPTVTIVTPRVMLLYYTLTSH